MKRACVIGWPVSHSRSPLIHGYWLARHGIDGSYTRVAVRPEDAPAFLGSLQAEGYVGCNVTIPHKEMAYAVAAKTLPAARAAGAANTLWYEDGRLVADNSDAGGFVSNLAAVALQFDFHGAVVSVLGAGVAARGMALARLVAGVGE